MLMASVTVNIILALILVYFLFNNVKKIDRLNRQFEEMGMEQSKINFRMFVLEKKQKKYYEHNVC